MIIERKQVMLLNKIAIIISFGLIWHIEAIREFKIVNTENGRVRGYTSNTLLEQKEIVSFTGIPYAKPPVGRLRFEVFSKKSH